MTKSSSWTTIAIELKIVSVSSNTNSFGLYGVVLMSREGHTFEIAVGGLYMNHIAKGGVLTGIVAGDKDLRSISGITYELPRYLGKAHHNHIKDVWSNKSNELTNVIVFKEDVNMYDEPILIASRKKISGKLVHVYTFNSNAPMESDPLQNIMEENDLDTSIREDLITGLIKAEKLAPDQYLFEDIN